MILLGTFIKGDQIDYSKTFCFVLLNSKRRNLSDLKEIWAWSKKEHMHKSILDAYVQHSRSRCELWIWCRGTSQQHYRPTFTFTLHFFRNWLLDNKSSICWSWVECKELGQRSSLYVKIVFTYLTGWSNQPNMTWSKHVQSSNVSPSLL